jgi:hypothetical protein
LKLWKQIHSCTKTERGMVVIFTIEWIVWKYYLSYKNGTGNKHRICTTSNRDNERQVKERQQIHVCF